MKTIRWLNISIILQSIFAFFCISSSVCFALNRYLDMSLFFSLGNILVYGWIFNPLGFLSAIVGLILFFSEKAVDENRKIIGKKWICFIFFFIFDIILYSTAGVLMVVFTGGV